MLNSILKAYQLDTAETTIIPFGSGLINQTWKVCSTRCDSTYILQRINTAVFKSPEDIAFNIRIISDHLSKEHPDYLFISPLRTIYDKDYFYDENNHFFRLFPFLEQSHSIDSINSPSEVFEAARQFALFTKKLSSFEASQLKTTIPDFHNLSLRHQQFKEAIATGNLERIRECKEIIFYLQHLNCIVDAYESLKSNPEFRTRVTHHDTKISNVLFDKEGKGICVIDLDTVMPGYFISDVGDMMRTYLSQANEEEADLSRITVREDYFESLLDGYLSVMKDELTPFELSHFVYSGKFMIYMQALRFLTDYLNNDIYYGAKYGKHNLVRAQNQCVLLQKLIEKDNLLNEMVRQYSRATA